jgi:voltage-gated potassium channel Kch
MIIMGWMGYRKRTGFLAGLTVAQISEFSLILGAMALSLGHIEAPTLGLITLVGLVTIGVSTYMILYSHWLYDRLSPWLRIFERRIAHREGSEAKNPSENRRADVIVFGLGRYGSRIAEGLRAKGWAVLGVDFDPQAVEDAERNGLRACYGDAEDSELIGLLPLADCRWVVCTSALPDANLTLLHALRQYGYRGRIALAARAPLYAARLERAGADLVLCPHPDAADRAVERLLPASTAEVSVEPKPAQNSTGNMFHSLPTENQS